MEVWGSVVLKDNSATLSTWVCWYWNTLTQALKVKAVNQKTPNYLSKFSYSTPQEQALGRSHPLCRPISSSVAPFSSCLQSFPASGSFPTSQLLASGDQRIGASASVSGLPMNIQGWFPLGLAGWISLLSKGLSSLLQHHSSKASILWHSASFMVRLSHPCMTVDIHEYRPLSGSDVSAFQHTV